MQADNQELMRSMHSKFTILDSKFNPYKVTNLVPVNSKKQFDLMMKFGVENCNVDFASPLIERNVATHSLTHCSLIASIRGPTQVRSAYHTQSSKAKFTCSSTAAWLSPILLPNTPFRSTVAACSIPYPPAVSAKRNVPVTSRLLSSERTKLSALHTPWGTLPASILQSYSLQAYLARNVGKAAGTYW